MRKAWPRHTGQCGCLPQPGGDAVHLLQAGMGGTHAFPGPA